MQPAPARTVFDVITDFLASEPASQAILEYRLPAELEVRALQLRQLRVTIAPPHDPEAYQPNLSAGS